MDEKQKCKWCGKLMINEKLKLKHEEICDSNDGGREYQNYEDIAQKYF